MPDGQPSHRAEFAILAAIGQSFLGLAAGRHLAPAVAMAAPRTVWRIRLQDGSVVHCVLWERKPETAVVWYRDDEVQGMEGLRDPAEAEDKAKDLMTALGPPDDH